jgi:hypothetical protein
LPFPRKCWHAYLFTKEHENRIAPILGSLLTWKCTCFCTFTLLFTFYKALCLIVLFMFTFYQPLWNVIYFHLVHFGTFKCYVHILSVTFMCYLEVKVFFTAFFFISSWIKLWSMFRIHVIDWPQDWWAYSMFLIICLWFHQCLLFHIITINNGILFSCWLMGWPLISYNLLRSQVVPEKK